MFEFLAPRLSPAYRDCKVPLLLVTMLGDFAQGQLVQRNLQLQLLRFDNSL